MKRIKTIFVPSTLALVAMLGAACSLFQTPAPPTVPPPPPPAILTEVAQTLTAVAPTLSAGTPIPPATQIAAATATPAPGLPTPVPSEGNPPTVQLLSPPQNSQVTTNQTVAVIALAADDSGISRIDLYADNVFVSSQSPPQGAHPTTYQAVFNWSSAAVGPHTLFVIAYDPWGNASTPAAVAVAVNANTSAPQVTILSPTSPQTVNLGAQLTLQVVAYDEAGVTQLQLLLDNQPYTQVNSPNPAGQSPFAANFIYAANTPGAHTLMVRAVDSAGNLGTSSPFQVNVGDTNPPSVNTTYSRVNVRENEQVVVYTNAADPAGILRVELWVDNALYNVYNVPNPPQQTSIAIQQIWASNIPGNHTLFVRAFDANNQSTTTPATNIFVRQPDQPTPTLTPFRPTRTPHPVPTPTPFIPPPSVQMNAPSTNFRDELPSPIVIDIVFSAPAGLATLEIYSQYSGTMATQIRGENAGGATERRITFDWTPPAPGVLSIFAVATDLRGQRTQGPAIPGVVHSQRPPTIIPPPTLVPPPPQPSIAGRWRGEVDNGFFIINLEPRIGCSETACAYGGTFEDHREGQVVSGPLSGQLSGNSLSLSMEGGQPGDVTWNFQGEVISGGREIAGEWTESRAGVIGLQRGSVTFRR